MAPTFSEKLSQAKIWSATPTPLTNDLRIDIPSIHRMVEHHLRIGCNGLFLAGTCGEGPWISRKALTSLIAEAVNASAGRLLVSVQVSDNSSVRILENIEVAAKNGADIAIIAPPLFLMNATQRRLVQHYAEVSRYSPLPLGVYDRGENTPVYIPTELLREIYGLEQVVRKCPINC